MQKRGQSSVETVVILSFLLIILATVLNFNIGVMTSVKSQYDASKISAINDELVETARFIYTQGSGSKSVIFMEIPREIVGFDLTGHVMNVTINNSDKIETAYRKTDFFFNGSIPSEPGNYCLLFESFTGYVSVSVFNGTC